METPISQIDYLKEDIFDVLDLIDRANRSIERHQALSPLDVLAIEGFKRIREQHASRLDQLMAQFGLHLAKTSDNTGEYHYAMAS